jgi:hypothetical protein
VEPPAQVTSPIEEIYQKQQADLPWIPGRFNESSLPQKCLHPSFAEYTRTRGFETKKKIVNKIYSVLHPDNQLWIAEQGHYDNYPDYFKENIRRCVLGDLFSEYVLISRRFSEPGKPCLIRMDSDLNSNAIMHMSQDSSTESLDSGYSPQEIENDYTVQHVEMPSIALEPVEEENEPLIASPCNLGMPCGPGTPHSTGSPLTPGTPGTPMSPYSPRSRSPRLDVEMTPTPTKQRSNTFNAMLILEAEKIRKARAASEGSAGHDGRRRSRIRKLSPYKMESGVENGDLVNGTTETESSSEPRRRRSGLSMLNPGDLSQLREEVEQRERAYSIGDERRKELAVVLSSENFQSPSAPCEDDDNFSLLPSPESVFGTYSPRCASPTCGFEGLPFNKVFSTDIMAASAEFGRRRNSRNLEFDLELDFEEKRRRFVSMSSESTDYSEDSCTPTDEFSHDELFNAPLVESWNDVSDAEDNLYNKTMVVMNETRSKLVGFVSETDLSESESVQTETDIKLEESTVIEDTPQVSDESDYDIYYGYDELPGDEDEGDVELWDVAVQVELGPHTLVTADAQIAAIDLENVQTQTDLSLLDCEILNIDGTTIGSMSIDEKELNSDVKKRKRHAQNKLVAIKEMSDPNYAIAIGIDVAANATQGADSTDEFSESGFCSMTCDVSLSPPIKSNHVDEYSSSFDPGRQPKILTNPGMLYGIDSYDAGTRSTERVEDFIVTKRVHHDNPRKENGVVIFPRACAGTDHVSMATDDGLSETGISLVVFPGTDRAESKIMGNRKKVIRSNLSVEVDLDLEVELTLMGVFEYDTAPDVATEVVITTSPGDLESTAMRYEEVCDHVLEEREEQTSACDELDLPPGDITSSTLHDESICDDIVGERLDKQTSPIDHSYCIWTEDEVNSNEFCNADSASIEHLKEYSGAYDGLPIHHDKNIDSTNERISTLKKMSQSISLPNLRDPRFYCYEPEKKTKVASPSEISLYLRLHGQLPDPFYSFHQKAFWISAGDLSRQFSLVANEPIVISDQSESPVYSPRDESQQKRRSQVFSFSSNTSDQSERSVNSARDESTLKRNRAFSISSNDGNGFLDSIVFLNTANQSETKESSSFSASKSATYHLDSELNLKKSISSAPFLEDENKNHLRISDCDISPKDGNLQNAVYTVNHVTHGNHDNDILANQNTSSSHVTLDACDESISVSNQNGRHDCTTPVQSKSRGNTHIREKKVMSSVPPIGGATSPVILERKEVLKQQMEKVKGHDGMEKGNIVDSSGASRVDSKNVSIIFFCPISLSYSSNPWHLHQKTSLRTFACARTDQGNTLDSAISHSCSVGFTKTIKVERVLGLKLLIHGTGIRTISQVNIGQTNTLLRTNIPHISS